MKVLKNSLYLLSVAAFMTASKAQQLHVKDFWQGLLDDTPTTTPYTTPSPLAWRGSAPQTAVTVEEISQYNSLPVGTWYKYRGLVLKKGTPIPSIVTNAEYDAVPVGASYVFRKRVFLKGLTGILGKDTLTTYIVDTKEEYEEVSEGASYSYRELPILRKNSSLPGGSKDNPIRLRSKEDEANIVPGWWVIDSLNMPRQWTGAMAAATPTTKVDWIREVPDWLEALIGWGVFVGIVLTMVYAFVARILDRKAKLKTPERKARTAQVYHEYEQFKMAIQIWERDRELFNQHETRRLEELGKKAADPGKLGNIVVVGLFITVAVVAYVSGLGSSVFWWSVGGAFAMLCVTAQAKETFYRWRHRDLFVRREFDEPQPVYEPTAQAEERQERREAATGASGEVRVTSMRQAYEILGLPAGRTTIQAARAAYRTRVAEYHPDKVAHLGEELRELAARKALEINLAIQYMEGHGSSRQIVTNHSSSTQIACTKDL